MRRLPLYKTQGIVLSRKKLGERDKACVIYTSKFGKLESQVKGARRIKSRFSAAIEPFSLIDLSLWIGDYTSIVRESKIIKSFSPLREDMEKMETASFITKTTNSLVGLSHPDYKIFQLLLQSLLWIEERCDFLIKPFFIFKLLLLLGIFPCFSKCMCCQNEKAFGLNLKSGGLTCKEHLDGGIPLSAASIKIIESLSKMPISAGKRITIPENLKKEIDGVSQYLVSFHLSN